MYCAPRRAEVNGLSMHLWSHAATAATSQRCRGGKWNPSWLSPRTWARRLEMLKSTDVALGTDSGCFVLYWGTTEGECGQRMIKQTDNATFPPCVSLISAWNQLKRHIFRNKAFSFRWPFFFFFFFKDVRCCRLNSDIYQSGNSNKENVTYFDLFFLFFLFFLFARGQTAEQQTRAWHLKQLSVLWSVHPCCASADKNKSCHLMRW